MTDTIHLTLKIDKKKHALWKAYAKAHKTSLSAFIRKTVDENIPMIEKDFIYINELREEIRLLKSELQAKGIIGGK